MELWQQRPRKLNLIGLFWISNMIYVLAVVTSLLSVIDLLKNIADF